MQMGCQKYRCLLYIAIAYGVILIISSYFHLLDLVLGMEGFLNRELSPEQQNSLLASEMCMLLLSPRDKPTNGYVILTSRELIITNSTLPPKSILKHLNLKNLVSVNLSRERPLFLEKKYQDTSTHIEVIFEINISKKKHTSLLNLLSTAKYSPQSRSPSSANNSDTDSPTSSKRSIPLKFPHSPAFSAELYEKAKVKIDIFTLRADSRLLDYLHYAFLFVRVYSLSSCAVSDSEERSLSLPQTSIESLFEEIKQELAKAQKLTDKFSICRELIYAAHQYTHIYNLFWKHSGIISKFLVELRLYLTPQDTLCSTNNRADELEFAILLMTGIKNSLSYPGSIEVRVKALNTHISIVTSLIQIALTEPWRPEGLSKQALVEFDQLRTEYFRESFIVLTHLYEISVQSSWILNKFRSITPHVIACLIESNSQAFFFTFSALLHSFISMLSDEQYSLNSTAILAIYSFLKLIEFIHSSSQTVWMQILKTHSEELRDYFNPTLLMSRFKAERLIINVILSLSHWLHSSVKLHI